MMTLRELREARLMTQRELSKQSGVAYTTISRIESGKHRPGLGTLRKLAAGLGVEPEAMAEIRQWPVSEGLKWDDDLIE